MREVKETSGVSTGVESLRASPKVLTAGDRKLLKVELRPGETTYVSWKKLMRDASKVNGLSASVPDPPPNANPSLESRLAPGLPAESDLNDQPHSNRFNAVIEKIERLYKGKDSSDGEELDSAPDDDEYDTEDSFIDDAELDEYFEVDNSAVKHDGFFVNRGILERMEPSTISNQQPRKRRRKDSAKPSADDVDVSNRQTKLPVTARGKGSLSPSKAQNANVSLSRDNVKYPDKANHQARNAISHKSEKAGPSNALHQNHSNKYLHQQSNILPGKSPPKVFEEATVSRQKECNGMHGVENGTGNRQSIQTTRKGGSNMKPRTSTLEKAIRELEKVVAESRPPAATENQEADTSSQAVKRRLPREVKINLAKVARIAQASQGKISAELINRLMSIVGHLIQLRSLKRNLKIMSDMSDSANREKDARFQRINNEVHEMIKSKVSLMETQATKQGGTSDDNLDTVQKPPSKKFVIDVALEDKLCDLYDIFVDGLDEDAGPQIRKLYVNLAELWPNKLMDNHGIKRAICRAKERQRALRGNRGKEMDQTKIRKRKQLIPRTDSTARPSTASQHSGEKKAIDSTTTNPSLIPSQPIKDTSRNITNPQHEKLKGSSSSSNPVEETRVARRKIEPVLERSRPPAEKQLVLALMQQEHPQLPVPPHAQERAIISAPQNLNLQQTPPDLNLPS